jgi:hypothetical protein
VKIPVDGPLEVPGADLGVPRAGCCTPTCASLLRGIGLAGHEARARALKFSWDEATRLFQAYLVPAHAERVA